MDVLKIIKDIKKIRGKFVLANLVVGCILHVADKGSDVYVAIQYLLRGEWWWFSLTLAFIVFPLTMHYFSNKEDDINETNQQKDSNRTNGQEDSNATNQQKHSNATNQQDSNANNQQERGGGKPYPRSIQ